MILRFLLVYLLFFGLAWASDVRSEIEALLGYVENLDGATFIRNGDEHRAKVAAGHLRMKWSQLGKKIATAEDFIQLCASKSSFSGERYKVRFSDGRERFCDELLRDKLKDLRTEAERHKGTTGAVREFNLNARRFVRHLLPRTLAMSPRHALSADQQAAAYHEPTADSAAEIGRHMVRRRVRPGFFHQDPLTKWRPGSGTIEHLEIGQPHDDMQPDSGMIVIFSRRLGLDTERPAVFAKEEETRVSPGRMKGRLLSVHDYWLWHLLASRPAPPLFYEGVGATSKRHPERLQGFLTIVCAGVHQGPYQG